MGKEALIYYRSHILPVLTGTRPDGHIALNTPVLVRSPKSSSVELSQYLDG